jgi:hypothetical protein
LQEFFLADRIAHPGRLRALLSPGCALQGTSRGAIAAWHA